jgi:hypothetical protein
MPVVRRHVELGEPVPAGVARPCLMTMRCTKVGWRRLAGTINQAAPDPAGRAGSRRPGRARRSGGAAGAATGTPSCARWAGHPVGSPERRPRDAGRAARRPGPPGTPGPTNRPSSTRHPANSCLPPAAVTTRPSARASVPTASRVMYPQEINCTHQMRRCCLRSPLLASRAAAQPVYEQDSRWLSLWSARQSPGPRPGTGHRRCGAGRCHKRHAPPATATGIPPGL